MPQLVLVDPATGEPLSRHTVTESATMQVYELVTRALDYAPETTEFAVCMRALERVADAESVEAWVRSLAAIQGGSSFVLEDWIDRWYVSEYVGARYEVIRWEPDGVYAHAALGE